MGTSSPPRGDRAATIVLGVSAALFVVYARYFTRQIGDDSFIYFRYAENVARGWGLVWNPGERVEAFSSPLWMGILCAVRAVGVPCATFARVAGPLLAGGAIAIGYRTGLALGASRLHAALGVLLACLEGSVCFWAPSGLETPLSMLTLGIVALAIARRDARGWAMGTALLALARPEGGAIAVVCVVAAVVAYGKAWLRPAHLAIALAPVAAYLVFRLAYYGVPLPNTYYAKATGPLGRRLVSGVDYVLWVGLAALASLALAVRSWRRTGERVELGVLVLLGAVLGVVLVGGGDWMWGRRLLTPVIPPLFAVLAAQATRLERPGVGARTALAAATMFLAINDDLPWLERQGVERWFTLDGAGDDARDPLRFLALRFVGPARALGRALRGEILPPGDRQEGTMTDASVDAASWIRAHYPPDALVAVNHAGALPFFLENPCLDMVGLADAHIARDVRGALHDKIDPAYVLAREPAVVVLNTRTRPGDDGVWYHEGYWEGETALVRAEGFRARYRAVPVFFRWGYSGNKPRFIVLYERVAG